MNDKTAPSGPSGRQFQAEIYRDLDRRLKASRWNSGASEAHGLLSALACLGIPGEQLRAKAWLFQLSEKTDLDLLEGLYGLILRDLQSDGFEFNLLLPDGACLDGTCSDAQSIESLADWCGGFVQGFLHDDAERLDGVPDPVRESVNDIMEISRMEVEARVDAGVDTGVDAGAGEETEKQLVEIEEYLRVAIQVIFEELNPRAGASAGMAGLN